MKRIVITDLHKSFDIAQRKVLDGIHMALAPGINCLMGASGIGKTTLARILAGLAEPDSGTVIWQDFSLPPRVKQGCIGYVFQEDRLLEWQTALANLLFVDTQKNSVRAIDLLTQAGLADSIHKKAADLSGGMKRRVTLCRALMGSHDLLILDEPFKGLDDNIKQTAIKMVQVWHSENPEAILLCITHDEDEVRQLGGQRLHL
ncbi:MAG: ATP-binding cassette domain-containing protein [Defluviitaleaceae bacterium]|nr:ATP-binding cassette domain-containing protein [Defluviitaleaceae bacterium]